MTIRFFTKFLTVTFVALAMSSNANADMITVPIDVTGFDNGAPVSQPIDFGVGVLSIESISIELSHAFAEDVDIGLYAPTDDQTNIGEEGDLSNSASYLLTEILGPDRTLGDGDGDDLDGLATYTFLDPNDPNATGLNFESSPENEAIPGGTYDAIEWGEGGTATGWVLSFVDGFDGDSGAIGTATINFTPVTVPEPTSLAVLLGLSGLAACRRRR